MKYFIDTEFVLDAGLGVTFVHPISIALVCEDGRELYLHERPNLQESYLYHGSGDFVREQVLPVLDALPGEYLYDHEWMERILIFMNGTTPEFWGDYAAFDYAILAHANGGFDNWPEDWPMHINDLQQLGVAVGASDVPHNALSDARAVRDAYMAFERAMNADE